MTLHEVIANAVDGHAPLATAIDHVLIDDVTDAVTTYLTAAQGPPVVKGPADLLEQVSWVDVPGTLEVSDDGTLAPDQHRRVAALKVAREVLETRGAAGALSAPGITPPDTIDLVQVAQWVIDGADPWPVGDRQVPPVGTFPGEPGYRDPAQQP